MFVDTWAYQIDDPQQVAKRVSARHTGIGSDGLILVGPASDDSADWRMRIFNADGSEAQICGNGLRCAAKFAYERGLCAEPNMNVQTGAGIMQVELCLDKDVVSAVRVNMGKPHLEPHAIPTTLAAGKGTVVHEMLHASSRFFDVTCISMGNPHAVIFTPVESSDEQLHQFGPLIERHAAFPERANVHFVSHIDGGQALRMRSWERGSGVTKACGSGACAVGVAAHLTGFISRREKMQMMCDGGELTVEWSGIGAPVFLEGPAEFVFQGVWGAPPSQH